MAKTKTASKRNRCFTCNDISAHNLRAVASRALVHPDTVRAYLTGSYKQRPLTMQAIEEALEWFGFEHLIKSTRSTKAKAKAPRAKARAAA